MLATLKKEQVEQLKELELRRQVNPTQFTPEQHQALDELMRRCAELCDPWLREVMTPRPWLFTLDQNKDGIFTISDVWALLVDLFFLPGASALYWLYVKSPALSQFLEIDPSSFHGILSGVFSFIVWGIIYLVLTSLE